MIINYCNENTCTACSDKKLMSANVGNNKDKVVTDAAQQKTQQIHTIRPQSNPNFVVG